MGYLGIHNHTDEDSNLRLRDTINKVNELIDYTHELGMKGVCFTGHESITSSLSAIEYYFSKKDLPEWKDFKIGLGNEIYLCTRDVTAENKKGQRYPHFILLALDEFGHKGIRELSTNSWLNNSFMNVMMRVPTYYDELENMLNTYKGHIIGSSACLGGALPNRILQILETDNMFEKNEIWESCIEWAEYMNEIFGQGYFFLELQPSLKNEQIFVNKKLIELSEITGAPYLISTDAHYLKKEDKEFHKIYLESQDGDREVDDFYETTYVMSSEEIHSYMDDSLGYKLVQKGLDNTLLIYDKIQIYDLRKPMEIPYVPFNTDEPDKDIFDKYNPLIKYLDYFYNSEHDSDRHLCREIINELDKKTEELCNEETYDAISECLESLIIASDKMNVRWSAYLLDVEDIIKLLWEVSLVGCGRGSGVGFILNYILHITQINPLKEKTKTYPWRFLNPERASPLDIDVDIEGSKRDAVMQKFRDTYGADRISKVMTLSTEKGRSAILTAARGLGIDNDLAQYIASLMVADRGQLRTLKQMYYGDDDNKPVVDFVREMDRYPQLWECALKFEGLVNGVGSHAGGIILNNKPFTEVAAQMKTNSGDIITQFDLHGCEKVSLIKFDCLSVEALDKIHACLNLLLENGVIEWQGTLKDTYEKYLGVYTLERDSEDMWKMLWEHKVLSFFQMEKESGVQAISLSKPHSVDDLAALNSVMRLMAQEKGGEAPLQKYARFKEDISLWYEEMSAMGLTEEEQDILKEILGISYGICEAQEYLFLLVMHPKIGGFSLAWADKLRKSVAKKSPKDFEILQKEFLDNAKEKKLSNKLIYYVWFVLIFMQRGYGFNRSHCLAYSLLGLQELNLCYKYGTIYWSAANLIVDSGSYNEEANDGTNYGKMASAIASVIQSGVNVELPLINEAGFGFKVDKNNNQIIFSLKAVNGLGTELVQEIIKNRPYISMEDFIDKLVNTKIITTSKMIKLIKGGCFVGLHNPDRRVTMDWYLRNYVFKPCDSLTMQQFNKMKEINFIPESMDLPLRMINFKNYVLDDEGLYKKHINEGKKIPKRGYHDGYYILDNNSQPFFKQHFTEDSVVDIKGEYYIVSEKKFTKEVDSYIQPLKDWMALPSTLEVYNEKLFQELWNKHAEGSVPHWNMEALCYYDGEHELEHVDEKMYGIVNFFDLPEEPEPYEWYTKYISGEPKSIPKYKISRIAGTVLNADNMHRIVTILTKYGSVNIKVSKGHYAFYNKTISQVGDDGKKKRLEESWFKRGNLITCQGIRRSENFIPLVYSDTIYKHTFNLIQEVREDGSLLVQSERTRNETKQN